MNVDSRVAILVDTNILVYFCDGRDLRKREHAVHVLREGQISGEMRLAHQSLSEFMHSVTRTRGDSGVPLMTRENATRQAEYFLREFPILYPDDQVFRTALLGMGAYKLSWFDAHLWAYAERYGIPEILSEDFQHGRMYGHVKMRNPFLELGLA